MVGLKTLADFPIGVAVNAGNEANSIINSATSAQQQAAVLPHFDQVTAGNIMKMSYLHPSENTYSFTQADELVNFASARGMTMHAHTLIWHSDYQVPTFMKNYSGDFSAMLKTHVQTVASHFAGKVDSWDVVNEALAEDGDASAVNGYRNSVFYQKLGAAFIDQAFINTRAVDPVADLYYNDFNIENNGTKTTNLLAMIDGMKARNIPITGVGFQMHVLLDWPTTSTIESTMRAVASRGLKVKITELDVRVNNIYNASAPKYTSLTAEAAALQKQRYSAIVAAYLRAVPAAQRGGITVWGVWDTDSWLNTPTEPDWPLLFDANFQAKPALQGFVDALISGTGSSAASSRASSVASSVRSSTPISSSSVASSVAPSSTPLSSVRSSVRSSTASSMMSSAVSSSTANGCSGSNNLFCLDFENVAPGATPAGFTKEGNGVNIVEGQEARSGTRSVKFRSTNAGDYGFFRMNAVSGKHWGRLYYKMKTPVPNINSWLHGTFVTSRGNNAEFRFVDTVQEASGKHQYIYNSEPGDVSLQGEYAYTFDSSWVCTEWYVDSQTQTYKFFRNGQELFFTRNGQVTDKTNLSGFTAVPATLDSLGFGFRAYQQSAGVEGWLDDVAVGSERIGCGNGISSSSTPSSVASSVRSSVAPSSVATSSVQPSSVARSSSSVSSFAVTSSSSVPNERTDCPVPPPTIQYGSWAPFDTNNVSQRVVPNFRDYMVNMPVFNNGVIPLPYNLHQPAQAANSSAKFPLVIYLHGGGERGKAQEHLASRHALPFFASSNSLLTPTNLANKPTYIVAPQCECEFGSNEWSSTGNAPFSVTGQPSKYGKALTDLIENLKANYAIDPDRIYVTGISMGGGGAWELAARRPDLIAAAIPMSGIPVQTSNAAAVAKSKVVVWAQKGNGDENNPVSDTVNTVNAIAAANGCATFSLFPTGTTQNVDPGDPQPSADLQHTVWMRAYLNPQLWDYVFSVRRAHVDGVITSSASSIARSSAIASSTPLSSRPASSIASSTPVSSTPASSIRSSIAASSRASSIGSSSSLGGRNHYNAPKANTAPVIDGQADAVWNTAEWAPIDVRWLGSQAGIPPSTDYSGRYKALWDNGNLYLLFDITDDRIYDGHRTATDSYWEDDTVELFIDENKSGGQHEYNTSAWAYHVSTYGDVVDYTTSGPKLLNDHLTMRMVSNGDKHMWEMSVRIYDASYADNSVNTPLVLAAGKLMGFSAAYIDNDGSSQRESMMGSVDTQGHRDNRGYQDASVFGTMQLVDSGVPTSSRSSSSSVASSTASSAAVTGDATRGKALWESTAVGCVFCHAVNSDGTAGTTYKIDPKNLRFTTVANLVNYITVNMPKGNPTACVGQCAADTAAYFLSLKPVVVGSTLVSEDFELGVLNTPPADWEWIITNSSIVNQLSSQAYALVDNTRAHAGSKSLRVKTDPSASSPVWLMKKLPTGIGQAYIRAWMYSPIQLGNNGSQNSGNHGAFLGTVTAKDNNANEQRYGLVEGTRIGAFQPKPGDTPNTTASGDSTVYVPAGRWTCVEFGLDVTNNKLYGWIDDKASFTVASLSDWKQGGAALTAADLNYVEFGWRGFGSTNPSDLWFDDIIVSTSRVGCN